FLQAKLHIDSLARQTNVKALRKALEELPDDIWRSYDNAMLQIDAQGETDSKLAYYIFYWLSCSKRPLTILELQHAVAVSLDPEMTDMEPEAIVDIETLTDVCAGLIITTGPLLGLRSQFSTVRLVHYTMQEYLQLNQQRLLPDIHSLMAITCLAYMSFNAFSTKEWEVGSRYMLFRQYPLYKYAALFWGQHACDNQEQIFPHAQRFLQKPANVACASKVYLLPDHGLGPADGALLHLASLLGHVETVMVLLSKLDPNTQNENSRTPLSYSAEHGQFKMVQVFLDLELIQPDLPDKNGCTPFIHASHHGHVEIVQLFLNRHDVNHNLRDYNGWTALFHAVDQKHLYVTQILLRHSDIQPDIPDNTGKTPLIWAAQQSPPSWTYFKLMEALLKREDVNPDFQDEHLRTALSYSAGGMCLHRFEQSMCYKQTLCLLKKGATVDLQDKYLRTPLSYAIESHQPRIIKLLLEKLTVDRYSP
ncbi:ankyrin repeat-containing domain protein, partial [Mycena floridula]